MEPNTPNALTDVQQAGRDIARLRRKYMAIRLTVERHYHEGKLSRPSRDRSYEIARDNEAAMLAPLTEVLVMSESCVRDDEPHIPYM